MSHVSKIEVEISDLASLKRACQRLGFQFREGQKTYVWYGRLVQPELYPLPEGMTQADLGKCHHAISIPGAKYEVGVIRRGNSYTLLADFWDTRLKNALGDNGGKLKQAYAVERTMVEAKRRNYRVVEHKTDTGIRITLTR